MALLFWDSFDHYADGDVLEKWSTRYFEGGSSVTVGAYGRNSTNGVRITGRLSYENYLRGPISSSPDTVFVGLGYIQNTAIVPCDILALLDNSTVQVFLVVNADLSISAYGGGVLRATTAPGTIIVGVYHYIEIKTVIDNAAGLIEVRVDDVEVINVSGIDTQVTGNSQVTQLQLGRYGVDGSTSRDYDDVYVCDDAGSTCNDFLGDTRVCALFVDGSGTHADWTPSAGNNEDCVDENPPNDDTDYNSTATATDRDSFSMDDLPAGISGTIHAVCAVINCRKDDAGTRTLQPSVRTGGADFDGSSVNIPSDYAYHVMYAWEVNPDTTNPWAVAEVNAMESGYELVA